MEPLDDLEEILVTSDVGVDTTIKIIRRIEERVARDKYVSTSELNSILKSEITALLTENNTGDNGEWTLPEGTHPYVILVVGVNGVGKTTTIGKLAWQFKQAGKKVYLGAADTFRAAAVEQIQIWGDRVGVPVVKQQMGADPASVAFDTLQSAKANGADVVIIDTAGRLHNKVGLMNELTKIKNVMKKVVPNAPDEVLLVLDGSTGQNAFEQAKQFTLATEVTSMAITKLDGTAKGGVVIGISDQFKIPVKYIGVGISFPILSGLDRNAGIRKKKLNLQRVRNSIEEEKLHLRNETERIVLSLHSGWEEHRQASLQVKAETQVLKETERKWEEGLVSVFQLMEARNRLLVAKAEKIRVRLQYELTSRLTMYYRTGSFINH